MFRAKQTGLLQKTKGAKTNRRKCSCINEMISPIWHFMPRYGTEKLHLNIKHSLKEQNIKLGRDKFFRFCREKHLLVHKTKWFHITTDSMHFYYRSPNLIENLIPTYAGRGMLLSTTEKYDPYRNAAPERINGILKYEFGMVKRLLMLNYQKNNCAGCWNILQKKKTQITQNEHTGSGS